jgi:zinc protease
LFFMRLYTAIPALLCASIALAVAPPPTAAPVSPPTPATAPAPLPCDSVVELQTARLSGVTSAWLANGVRVHHRRIDRQPGLVVVTIALCGGKLLETPETRGLTEITAGVLDDWDSVAPDASRAARMEGRNLRIDAAAGQDAITLRLSGSKTDLDSGLAVVRTMLTGPSIAPETVESAKDQVIRELRRHATDPRAAVSEAVNQAVVPVGDIRLKAPDERSIRSITPEQVRTWIDRHARERGEPIEAAFVGDLSLAEALHLADAFLGALPARARPGADTHAALRRIPLPVGAVKTVVHADPAIVGQHKAVVVRGFLGPDMSELDDQRALRAMLRVATTRLKARLVAPRFTVSLDGPSAGLYMSAFPGLGMALVTTTVGAGEADAASGVIEEELDRLQKDGPTPEELSLASEDLARAADALDHDSRYWSAAVARCTVLSMDPDEIAHAGRYYRTLSPQRARDVLAKYRAGNRLIGITVRAAPAHE